MRSFYQKAAVVLSVAALLTGCAKEGEVQDTEKKQEDTVLTILVQQSGTNMSGTWEGESADRLYEETGIRLEFYSNGNGNEKRLKQYLAAGTLPDIIGFRDMEQAELLTGAGVLADLDEWEEELSDVFETSGYETALRYYRENFGGEEEDLYFLLTSVGKQGAEKDYWMPMVQWNAYEKAGCPQVEHLEDYLDAAEQMLEKKAMTAMGEPVYGFSLCSDWTDKKMQQPSSLYGYYRMDVGSLSPLFAVDAKTGTIQGILEEDSFYKQALHFYFEANQRELLDPDSRTQTFEKLQEKYQKGQILFSGYAWQTGEYGRTETKEEEQSDGYIPLVAGDMTLYQRPENPVGENWFFAVNKNSEKQEKACEFLNWFYTPENIVKLYEEKEGMDPYGKEEEKPVFQWLGLTQAEAGFSGEDPAQKKQSQGKTVEGCRAVYLMDALPAKLQTIESHLQEMVQELSWNMIYAETEEEFEQLWAEMLQRGEALGMEQLNAYYQKEWKQALEKEKVYGNSQK